MDFYKGGELQVMGEWENSIESKNALVTNIGHSYSQNDICFAEIQGAWIFLDRFVHF